MRAVSDIADWWDEQHRQSKKELDRFVDRNPGVFGIVVAGTTATFMDAGAGVVDMLRFGEGIAEGGIKGVGKDALRLIGLAGPLGRGTKVVQTFVNARLARLIVDPGGKICGWVSGTQAFRQTGTRAFAAVDDLAEAIGKPLDQLGRSRMIDRITLFRKIGATITGPTPVSTFDDVARMTKNDGSVTLFRVAGKKLNKQGVLEDAFHAVYAFRDTFGRLRILNRGGKGMGGEIFETLEQLATRHQIVGQWTVREAAVMHNVFAKFMLSVSSVPVLGLDVYAIAGLNKFENETVAQAFEIHKAIARGGKRNLEQQPNATYHPVVSGDWLSKLAQRYYGNMQKWPMIFEANRDVIGSNPDLIIPGQKLLIPALPRVNGIKG